MGAAPHLDVVPSEFVAEPQACGTLLDGHLVRLARQEALCRRVLGLVARAFLRRGSHRQLGFARVGDYTRERLGLSARELQDLARVADRLERLPAVAAAFQRGELSWTHVRLLASVASRTTDAAWLERARGITADELAFRIRLRAVRARAGTPLPLVDDDDIDGEPRLRFHVRCPQAVRRLWRDSAELASAMSGEPLPAWRAAEAVAAEALASPEVGRDDSRDGSAAEPDGPLGPSVRWTDDPPPEDRWPGVAETLPPDVAALARGLDRCDPFRLDGRLRAAQRALQRIDWQTGRLLRTMADRRLYRAFGCASLAVYVRERLGLSPRKARDLVALERRGRRVPALADAYRNGEISWLRALVLLPVLHESTAPAWLRRAREVTLRRLVAEVEWAVEVAGAGGGVETVGGAETAGGVETAGAFGALPLPPEHGARLVLPERQIRALGDAERCDAEVAFAGPASVVALFRRAMTACTRPGEPRWRGLARVVALAHEEWSRQPRHRDPVFARDGWRCATPACTSRRNLHDHHVVFRSHGGDNTRDNRITLCVWHHLRGVHGGVVRVRGAAPDELRWEIGIRRGGPPLLRTIGDRYATG
jgi:Domain of unknown function (DUF222)